ncbi:hypothetical protein BV20DRAFT_972373 [Pilatotrama ljubarskyi]|nr:hypothetical protein BV20DRAFT_972373 [Pilatotrama ljubarskyi]
MRIAVLVQLFAALSLFAGSAIALPAAADTSVAHDPDNCRCGGYPGPTPSSKRQGE